MLWFAVFSVGIILFLKPFRPIAKALIRGAISLPAIAIFNLIAQGFGFTLGVNLLNAILVGCLGIYGMVPAVALSVIF